MGFTPNFRPPTEEAQCDFVFPLRTANLFCTAMAEKVTSLESLIFSTRRPHPSLLLQYALWSLSLLVLFPLALVPLLVKYYTLRYRFDAEGVSMSWGFFFRREINLTYARIQDIQVSRGIIERWLGLGSVAIQTASGSSSAEMVIQGLPHYAELREFLYGRMRGHQGRAIAQGTGSWGAGDVQDHGESSEEAVQLLRQIHEDLRTIRLAIRPQAGDGCRPPGTP